MSVFQSLASARGQKVWVQRVEHLVLRLVSLAFSLASAHAIRWFFAPLDRVDILQPAITWMIAIGFGVLGYFVSRGLALRLMNKERIRAYVPICAVVELVEVFCNYALAAAVIERATWLATVPYVQRTALTALTYVVLAIIPLVSLLLAVVDMDLERSKHGSTTAARAAGSPFGAGAGSASSKGQPKWTTMPTDVPAPRAGYGQGYQGAPAAGKGAASAPFSPMPVPTPPS